MAEGRIIRWYNQGCESGEHGPLGVRGREECERTKPRICQNRGEVCVCVCVCGGGEGGRGLTAMAWPWFKGPAKAASLLAYAPLDGSRAQAAQGGQPSSCPAGARRAGGPPGFLQRRRG